MHNQPQWLLAWRFQVLVPIRGFRGRPFTPFTEEDGDRIINCHQVGARGSELPVPELGRLTQ